jgi:hypothetical protein
MHPTVVCKLIAARATASICDLQLFAAKNHCPLKLPALSVKFM